MASQVPAHLHAAFQSAKNDFLASLKDSSQFDGVSNIKSIDDVYNFTTRLQRDQSKRQGLRNLRKIAPYLDRLKQFVNVIEIFVQVKPDILALIWGPIKLLLQMSHNLTQSFDAIVEAMTGIGNKLPLFEAYTNMFETNDRVLDILVLFYKDILEFYAIVMNFFTAKRWVIVFESVWPRYKAQIGVVISSIERNSVLMTEEVTLASISEAHTARAEDMKRWQRTFEFQEMQDFDSVHSYISPNLYDDELDGFQRRVCKRTGRWLEREQVLKDWLDAGNAATRVLWMQGIPGAGKTYVASMMVENLRQSSHIVLFAFLSYKQKDTTPISIIHSIMFQLAVGDGQLNQVLKRDLRANISTTFRSSRRDLKSNTRFARETLTELLKCVGPVYIILDGLDEVAKSESMVDILNELLQILNDCTDVKLLISSRAQDEISRTINKVSDKVIRVDERNSRSIHAYVSVRTDDWLSRSGFDQKDCEEIKSLLNPLATKAKGMFLYARVVMDNVQMCYTPEIVKDELRVLPEGLDEAYSRVLDRLKNLPVSWRRICRRILGWIGCAPVSMTLEELSFATSLDPDGGRDLPRSESLLNVVELCGPIVETSNGYVNFVHFTVKEYLFDKENDRFLDRLETTIELTNACLHYLSSHIFDTVIEPEVIERNILTGSYRLHWFALSQWVVLLKECDRLLDNYDLPASLLLALNRFSDKCKNETFREKEDLESRRYREFIMIRDKEPELQRLLIQELHFRRQDVGEWKLEQDDKDDSWTDLDPFRLSFASMLIHETFESLLCQQEPHKLSCNCQRLKKLYGERLFRCHYAICQPLQTAFAVRADRDAHCRNHSRIYKCPYPSCDFSTMGFSSAELFGRHQDLCHVNEPLSAIQMIPTPEQGTIVPHLSNHIEAGMTAELHKLVPEFQQLGSDQQRALVRVSAAHGKLEIFQLLWMHACQSSNVDQRFLYNCASVSIKGDNIEVFEHISSNLERTEHYKLEMFRLMRLSANSESSRIFDIWTKHASEYELDNLLDDSLLNSLCDPARQERFADLLEGEAACSRRYSQDDLSIALRRIALSTCAPSIARVLLKNGADVEFRSKQFKNGKRIKTPLLAAAAQKTQAAAELMKILLLAGADPNAYYRARKAAEPKFVSMEIGARNISKWLPFTWNELVEWAAAERSNVLRAEGTSDVNT